MGIVAVELEEAGLRGLATGFRGRHIAESAPYLLIRRRGATIGIWLRV